MITKIKTGFISPVCFPEIKRNLIMPNTYTIKPNSVEDIEFKKFLIELGTFIRSRRKAIGHNSATTFANSINMDPDQLRKYERGEIPMTLKTLNKILKGLRTPGERLLKQLSDFQETTAPTKSQLLTEEAASHVRLQVEANNGHDVASKLRPEDVQRIGRILIAAFNLVSKNEVVKKVGLSSKSKNFNAVFSIVLNNEWIAMLYPESPKRHDQKYYTTEAGKKILRLADESK